MKRDTSVEFLRLVACMIILMCHINFYISTHSIFTTTFLSAVFSDSVGIFWMITGFFLFKNTNLPQLWLHTLRRIVIPTCFIYIFAFYFSNWFILGIPLRNSISHNRMDYYNVFVNLTHFNNPMPFSDHTWYIFAYLQLIFVFPLLKLLYTRFLQNKYIQICFFCISFLILLVNDLSFNNVLHLNFNTFRVLIPLCIEIITGAFLYQHKSFFMHKIFIPIGAATFFFSNIMRVLFSLNYIPENIPFTINTWQTSFGYVCAISLVILCFSFSSLFRYNEKRDNHICTLAKSTFAVYLLHPYFIAALQHRDFFSTSYDFLMRKLGEPLAVSIYFVCGSLGLYLLCTLVYIFYKAFGCFLKYICPTRKAR